MEKFEETRDAGGCGTQCCQYKDKYIKKYTETLPKAQPTGELSDFYQSNFFRSYNKFLNKSWSNVSFRISTKHQLKISNKHQHHNIVRTSPSKSQLNFNFKILAKPSFEILTKVNFKVLTKHQQYWFSHSFNFKILTKVWTKIKLRKTWPNFSFHIFSKLASTRFSTVLIINSNNFNKF